jgi:transcriptional regulator NrdR family protein
MTRWRAEVDISSIPDEILLAESARRMRSRQVIPLRAKVLRQCPKCGEAYGTSELRKHVPRCVPTVKTSSETNPYRKIRVVSSVEDQEAENYRYWQSLPIEERLSAVAEVTKSAYALKGVHPRAIRRHEGSSSRISRVRS